MFSRILTSTVALVHLIGLSEGGGGIGRGGRGQIGGSGIMIIPSAQARDGKRLPVM
jgi:hypothetical protein